MKIKGWFIVVGLVFCAVIVSDDPDVVTRNIGVNHQGFTLADPVVPRNIGVDYIPFAVVGNDSSVN